MIEYILVMTTVIMIIGGVLWQFNSAFRTMAGKYFGDYLTCLLQTGELPGQIATVCSPVEAKFNIADGKGLISGTDTTGDGSYKPGTSSPSGPDSGVGNNSNGSGASASSRGNAANKSGSQSGNSGRSGGGGGNETRQNGGSGSDSFLNTKFKPNRKAVTAIASSDSEGDVGSSLKGAMVSKSINFAGSEKRTILDGNATYFGEKEALDRERGKPAERAVASKDEQTMALKTKKLAINATTKAALQNDGEDQGYSFGAMFRFLLIAAIVVVIVVFFGGQIAQFSGSGDD